MANKKEFWVTFAKVFLPLTIVIQLVTQVDDRPIDGLLEMGWPLRFISAPTWDLNRFSFGPFAADLATMFLISVLVTIIWTKVWKGRSMTTTTPGSPGSS